MAFKLKETGTLHWASPNVNATNESGFTALGASWRHNGGGWPGLNPFAGFWSSSQTITAWAITMGMSWDFGQIDLSHRTKLMGYSVRCLKDY